MRPTAGVGAIRSGLPYAAAKAPATAAVYLDVRLLPGETPEFVRGDIERVLADADIEASVEPYLFRQGHVVDERAAEPLVDALKVAHETVRGGPPPEPRPEVTSMWRDSNTFIEAGVPAVNVGPPRSFESYGDEAGHSRLHVDDLLDTAKLYARAAIELCTDDD